MSVAIPAEQPSEVPPQTTTTRDQIPEDERYLYDDKGQLLGASFDQDLFSAVTRVSVVMNPEWALIRDSDDEQKITLAYELDEKSMYHQLFLDAMFADRDSRALVDDIPQLTVTNIDVIENPYLYSQFYMKGHQLRRQNGRVLQMMAYCVAPSYDDVVMGDLMPAGSTSLKLSATAFPLINPSVSEGALVYCKVLISKTGKTKPSKNSASVDTLAYEDGTMEKFAIDEVYPVCMIHYELINN